MAAAEAKTLLRVALRDLQTALLLEAAPRLESSWGFHIQQAIEKALKAWIIAHNRQARYIHNPSDLMRILADLDQEVTPYSELALFTVFAVELRYDDEPDALNLDRRAWHVRVDALVDHDAKIVSSLP
jgi:HEPN domain-containing protein